LRICCEDGQNDEILAACQWLLDALSAYANDTQII